MVLPAPGGPHRMIEPISPRSICARSGLPGPTMCSWPTNSSQRSGRIRSASGRVLSVGVGGSGVASNRPMTTGYSAAGQWVTLPAHTLPGRVEGAALAGWPDRPFESAGGSPPRIVVRSCCAAALRRGRLRPSRSLGTLFKLRHFLLNGLEDSEAESLSRDPVLYPEFFGGNQP